MNTHEVSYRGERVECTQDNYAKVCDDLFAKKGTPATGEYPVIKPLDRKVEPGTVDVVGKLRAESQEDMAVDAGFAPKPPVYSVGTRVIQMGVDNARRMQVEHDSKPSARDLSNRLVKFVEAEQRSDLVPERVASLRMDNAGRIVTPDSGQHVPMSERAFVSLFGRLPCRSGSGYLSDCPTKLRSINFNHWAVELEKREVQLKPEEHTRVVLRTRKNEGEQQRHVFGAVSPTYTAYDADKIGQALALAFPEDARGSLDYDGQRMRLEGLWRTDVAPSEFVAGEFFKAGVIIRADDTGGGSIRVQSVLWRNLCLNLIILDKAIGVDIRIRHVGDVRALAAKFRDAFGQALGSVEPFRKAWGYAMEVERDGALISRVQGTTSEDLSQLSPQAVLPGIFNGIIERELVPVRGRRIETVHKLMEMHSQDEARQAYGVSRASIVNAFTRFAHVIEQDPFHADLIREGAGGLLSGSRGASPAPLPYVALAA